VPQTDSEQKHSIHFKLGTVALGAGYSSWFGFPDYPYYALEPYGFYPYLGAYSPWLWGPYWNGYPLLYPGMNDPSADKGQIRLTAEPKTAQVFLDGAYAGTADQLKSIWLAPGAYTLSLSTPSGESFHQRIYVLTGKSLKVTAKLVAQASAAGEVTQP